MEAVTGKDSSAMLDKIKNSGDDGQNGIDNFSEAQIVDLLTDENSDQFLLENKQGIINMIYKLSKDKSILGKRIEQLEITKIRKDHMRMTKYGNGGYSQISKYEQRG